MHMKCESGTCKCISRHHDNEQSHLRFCNCWITCLEFVFSSKNTLHHQHMWPHHNCFWPMNVVPFLGSESPLQWNCFCNVSCHRFEALYSPSIFSFSLFCCFHLNQLWQNLQSDLHKSVLKFNTCCGLSLDHQQRWWLPAQQWANVQLFECFSIRCTHAHALKQCTLEEWHFFKWAHFIGNVLSNLIGLRSVHVIEQFMTSFVVHTRTLCGKWDNCLCLNGRPNREKISSEFPSSHVSKLKCGDDGAWNHFWHVLSPALCEPIVWIMNWIDFWVHIALKVLLLSWSNKCHLAFMGWNSFCSQKGVMKASHGLWENFWCSFDSWHAIGSLGNHPFAWWREGSEESVLSQLSFRWWSWASWKNESMSPWSQGSFLWIQCRNVHGKPWEIEVLCSQSSHFGWGQLLKSTAWKIQEIAPCMHVDPIWEFSFFLQVLGPVHNMDKQRSGPAQRHHTHQQWKPNFFLNAILFRLNGETVVNLEHTIGH